MTKICKISDTNSYSPAYLIRFKQYVRSLERHAPCRKNVVDSVFKERGRQMDWSGGETSVLVLKELRAVNGKGGPR
jgi:hypothetical protein